MPHDKPDYGDENRALSIFLPLALCCFCCVALAITLIVKVFYG